MSEPRKATFAQTPLVSWSDGTLFNGYGIFGLVIPTTDGTAANVWPQVNYGGTGLTFPIPKNFARVPIVDGKFADNLGLWYNADINPPKTQYVYYLVDSNNKLVTGASAFFTVSATPITVPVLSPTIPSQVNAVAPVPS